MDLKASVQKLFEDIKDVLKIVAPIMVFIGMVGAGILYAGSSWPPINYLKRNNPDLMNSLLVGIGILLAAGTISSLIVFS